MKICIVAGKGDRSGVPKYVSRLYETLKGQHDVFVVADGDSGFEEIDRHSLKLLPGLAGGRRYESWGFSGVTSPFGWRRYCMGALQLFGAVRRAAGTVTA